MFAARVCRIASRASRSVYRLGLGVALCVSALSCGGGDTIGASTSTPTGSNVVSVIVDAGPSNNDVNTLFTTVTVCTPGSTTDCQTIDHIQVDTGSYGLRLLAPVLTLTLPVQISSSGNALVECTEFVDGYSWGPIATADMQISGESAASVPVQVIGDSRYPTVPSDCVSQGAGTSEDTVASFGANGILGIGVFEQDCGSGCATTVDNGIYYSCTASQCTPAAVPTTSQVPNPVTLFAADNNGTIIVMPTVAEAGALSVSGSLIFGIDTQSNNASGTETLLTVDPSSGYVTTVFNGTTLAQSFIDSGSNATYFNDSTLTTCTQQGYTDFYCPASTTSLTATITEVGGAAATIDFTVDSAVTLGTNNPTFVVFPTLAGTSAAGSQSFDWGLPFYFGRRVATAIQGYTTNVGSGPYIAF